MFWKKIHTLLIDNVLLEASKAFVGEFVHEHNAKVGTLELDIVVWVSDCKRQDMKRFEFGSLTAREHEHPKQEVPVRLGVVVV